MICRITNSLAPSIAKKKITVLDKICYLLETVADKNDEHEAATSGFHSTETMPYSISKYVEHIFYCIPAGTRNETIQVAIILICRLPPQITLCICCVHRFFLAYTLIALKMIDDDAPRNSYLAYAGGVSVEELNLLEIKALRLLDFKIFVTEDQFQAFSEVVFKTTCNSFLTKQLVNKLQQTLHAIIPKFCVKCYRICHRFRIKCFNQRRSHLVG